MAASRRVSQVQGHLTSPATPDNRLFATQSASGDGGGPSIGYETRELRGGQRVATITVSNPSKLNIVNSQLLEQMVEVCNELAKVPHLRAVILTGGRTAPGKPPTFIGGADIKEMHSLETTSAARDFITRIHVACKALRDLPVPVIARVDGLSLGAGLEIMTACDLRLATRSSSFAMPEVKVGIPSVIEAALLPGLIGMGRTRRLLYLAEHIDAAEAEGWGLVDKVVNDTAELDLTVNNWVETIAEMGPKAIASQKKLMQKWENATVDEGIQAGVDAFGEAYANGAQEPKEYMGRFVNRKRQ